MAEFKRYGANQQQYDTLVKHFGKDWTDKRYYVKNKKSYSSPTFKLKKNYQPPTFNKQKYNFRKKSKTNLNSIPLVKHVRSKQANHTISFVFKLALCIVLIGLIGVSTYDISRKHYIKALDDSTIYYNYNFETGSITELEDYSDNVVSAYTDSNNSIVQNVITYDWLNKFETLKDLEPVFTYGDDMPVDLYQHYNNKPTSQQIADSLQLGGLAYNYQWLILSLYDENKIDMYFNTDRGCWQFSYSEFIKDKFVDKMNNYIFEADFTINQFVKFFAYPFKVGGSIIYNSFVILKFIFTW